ncbi:MAG TPA: DUF2125 domain-containing protein [Rhodopila sp.]|uniref:DUF2125 domain-containing protein n=1 Tax=Rhodopila sp. TaxID=2480087 RepID=UPI002CF00025|nr:DUF2125 domain-containing protein [Rhodopila sp.]HVY17215.1 DUF2125 domain-containing protein [Rhodopila sp.]
MSRRWYLYVVVILAIVLAGGDAVYWNWAASRMRDGLDAWIADRTAEGWHIEIGARSISGWPDAVTGRLTDVRMDYTPPSGAPSGQPGGGNPGGGQPGFLPVPLRFAAAEVRLDLALYRPTTLTVALGGEQRLAVADAPPVLLAEDALEAHLPLTGPPGHDVTVTGRGLRVEPATRAWVAHVAQVDGRASLAEPSGIDFLCAASGIDLPPRFKYPLGPKISDIAVNGTLNGPFPAGRTLADAAGAWRDGGGSLEVRHAAVDWGPLWLRSSATLALDDQLQPMGSGSAKVSGYDETLDHLAAAGVLSRSAATVAKAMLSLLAGTGTGGAPAEVEVPLTLQYRTLSMRQVPLVRLPELDWSQP